MLVVRRWRQDGGPDAGTPLPPLQPLERPAENTVESGGKGEGLESGQMPTRADVPTHWRTLQFANWTDRFAIFHPVRKPDKRFANYSVYANPTV